MKNFKIILIFTLLWVSGQLLASGRELYNFNAGWRLKVGDQKNAEAVRLDDSRWKEVTLPRAFNEEEAFRLSIDQLTDTVMWYRKHFRLPETARNKKVFIEFEGVRQAADFYVNGQHIGLHENGVMAVGFDITPYLKVGKENIIALRIDNNWEYEERASHTKYQWNNKNFNANYGGIPKNVWLHITDKVYQTLPLYSNLQTTGVYVYATDIDVKMRKAVIHAESEVRNESNKPQLVAYEVALYDRDNTLLKTFRGEKQTLNPGETTILKAAQEVDNLHFWSWGYGYLYHVKTRLLMNDKVTDEVSTRTGFRKTRFAEGKIWLNDRVIQMKGYAQRTSNEWPGVGMSVPPWLSDYSNGLMVKHGANLVRWMHVTPWKQDIESCDRVGLIQAMPAGDAEKDREGRQWEQRTELMRDAIIYNRNNPSILFYESGNESISREHMNEMKAIRDRYDPHGGRAIGSREMLDIDEAEYGGEMLYINKSAKHPMWAMEYSRDEGLRKYWDEYSYPYHKEGAGPLYRGKDASDYNHNQDMMAIENIRRWYDYWQERPGTGRRVSSGGTKIIFSDTNTHFRGEENYRRSGVVDPMRIPKDGFFVHQVMWDGWVDVEKPHTHIIGHWNYKEGVVKPVYVASSAERVELRINDKPIGWGRQEYRFLFTFDDVKWESGRIEAIGYDAEGREVSRHHLQTAAEPHNIKLTLLQSPQGLKADGADMVLVEVEVTDANGQRCPLANNMIRFTLEGPAEWRGGIAQGENNYILSETFPVECGVNRALIRSTTTAGNIRLTATAEGLTAASLSFASQPTTVEHGLSTRLPGNELAGCLDRGETPATPSYREQRTEVRIRSAVAGANPQEASNSYDDNELSEWRNDGRLNTAWITYQLERIATIDDICIKLTGWRMRSYPLEIYAGEELIWTGETDKSLGYVHLKVKPVSTDRITIRLKGSTMEADGFGQITELDPTQELDLYRSNNPEEVGNELRIVEIEFLETLNPTEQQDVYLFSYFKGDSKDGLHLAYSTDGLTWKPLNKGKSLLTPEVGNDKLMRDPSICRAADGTFHMVWTSSWTDRIIGYASSKDLIHWSEQKAIPVMMHEPKAHNSWAPELFYDEPSQTFYVFWATTIPGRHKEVTTSESEKGLNHRIYYVTTKDFKTFSKTKMFFNPDFSVIDAAIVKDTDNQLVMVVKNENSNPPEKNLRVTKTTNIKKGFPTKVSEPITGDYWAEGPAPLIVGEYLYVYFDKYRNKRYGAVRTKDRKTWEDVSDLVAFPRGTRHGTAFKVDKKVLDEFLKYNK